MLELRRCPVPWCPAIDAPWVRRLSPRGRSQRRQRQDQRVLGGYDRSTYCCRLRHRRQPDSNTEKKTVDRQWRVTVECTILCLRKTTYKQLVRHLPPPPNSTGRRRPTRLRPECMPTNIESKFFKQDKTMFNMWIYMYTTYVIIIKKTFKKKYMEICPTINVKRL